MDVMEGAILMSGGILDSFQTIIPTAAAVLSERRQMLRMTQQEVADRANITLRQYQRLESGERNILTSSGEGRLGQAGCISIPGAHFGRTG